MLHSTKSTNFSYMHCFFFTDKMSLRPDEIAHRGPD